MPVHVHYIIRVYFLFLCNEFNRALQTSPHEGFAGTMLLHHPHLDDVNYNGRDKGFRDRCCNIGSNMHCNKFFLQRSINDCTGYLPPAIGNLYISIKAS